MVPPMTDIGQTTASFSFRLEGESEIKASILAQVLLGFSDSLFSLSGEYRKYGDSYLLVSPIRSGSVEIPFVAVCQQFAQTTFPLLIQNAPMIVSTMKGMLDIKKALKGDKPKNVSEGAEFVHVESADGTRVTAPLGSRIVISNPRVDKAISSIGEASRLHNPSGGFWFSHGNAADYFSSRDAQDIALPQPFVEMADSRSSRSGRVTLPIKSLDLLGGTSWRFLYANRTITAKIQDSEYMQSVHSRRATYKSGDSLDVELETEEIRTPTGEVSSERYSITKVYSHNEQTAIS